MSKIVLLSRRRLVDKRRWRELGVARIEASLRDGRRHETVHGCFRQHLVATRRVQLANHAHATAHTRARTCAMLIVRWRWRQCQRHADLNRVRFVHDYFGALWFLATSSWWFLTTSARLVCCWFWCCRVCLIITRCQLTLLQLRRLLLLLCWCCCY